MNKKTLKYITSVSQVCGVFKKSVLTEKVKVEIVRYCCKYSSHYLNPFLRMHELINAEGNALVVSKFVEEFVENILSKLVNSVELAIEKYQSEFGKSVFNITFGDADLHPNGNIIFTVHGENGSYVYRPRSPDTDFYLKSVCAELSLNSLIKIPKSIVISDTFYWQHFISIKRNPKSLDWIDVGRFILICQIIGFTDLHSSNVIKDGDKMFLFDTETIFQNFDTFQDCYVFVDNEKLLSSKTPLITSLLPILRNVGDELFYDCALFGKQSLDDNPKFSSSLSKNIIDQIISGYLLQLSDFRTKDILIASIPKAGIRIRRVIRATASYANIVESAINKTYSKGRFEYNECVVDLLSINKSVSDETIEAEAAYLCGGEIPFFTSLVSSGEAEIYVDKNYKLAVKNKNLNKVIIQRVLEQFFSGKSNARTTVFRNSSSSLVF